MPTMTVDVRHDAAGHPLGNRPSNAEDVHATVLVCASDHGAHLGGADIEAYNNIIHGVSFR
jgi:hypothetical protein